MKVYGVICWACSFAAFAYALATESESAFYWGCSAFFSGTMLFSVASVGLHIMEILRILKGSEETLEDKKQRRFQEYQDSVGPPRNP